jgi:hypothetical protein
MGRAPGVLLRDAPVAERHAAVRKALLACGAASSLLYVVATDGVGAARWPGYSRTTQMVSDLFAVGSPARPLLVVLVVGGYSLLLVAFGTGVWASAHGNRSLRRTGAALAAYGAGNVVAGFFPLTLGDPASVPMHVVATNLDLVLMLAALGFGAAAFPGPLRTYSLATIATTVILGLVAFASAPGPSLWLGVGERISIGAFLLWVAVLAVAVWRSPEQGAGGGAGGRSRPNVFAGMSGWVHDRRVGSTGPQHR